MGTRSPGWRAKGYPRCRALLAGLVGAAALCIAPAYAGAHFSAGHYSYNSASCSGAVDPVGIIFTGNGTGANAAAHVAHHGWGATSGSSAQYFISHGLCGGMSHENADGGGSSTRNHIRLRKTYDADPSVGTTAQGTPHHEDYVIWSPSNPCGPPGGHAVDKGGVTQGTNPSGFDQGRNTLVSLLTSGGHSWGGWHYWGNTTEFQQCDGDKAGSHGSVGFVGV